MGEYNKCMRISSPSGKVPRSGGGVIVPKQN